MELLLISLLNGVSYGLLLFLLSAGLTLIFSMLGVLNFAHASFYMLGAYLGQALAQRLGFGWALLLAPLLVGLLGAWFERQVLRRVHAHGHIPELLVTYGLAYILIELVQLVWGRSPLSFEPPPWLRGPALTLIHDVDGYRAVLGAASAALCPAGTVCAPFPATRGFMMLLALVTLLGLGLGLARTRVGLVIQAALTHPHMVQALGHNLPRLFMLVFGVGAALAALAGVMGGSTFVTEPSMAATVGPVIFVVVVVGGLGSLLGAFVAALGIGLLQTLAVSFNQPLAQFWPGSAPSTLSGVTLAQIAPVLPYALLVAVLVLRPQGLLGQREG